jgi:hypothetical protein
VIFYPDKWRNEITNVPKIINYVPNSTYLPLLPLKIQQEKHRKEENQFVGEKVHLRQIFLRKGDKQECPPEQ